MPTPREIPAAANAEFTKYMAMIPRIPLSRRFKIHSIDTAHVLIPFLYLMWLIPKYESRILPAAMFIKMDRKNRQPDFYKIGIFCLKQAYTYNNQAQGTPVSPPPCKISAALLCKRGRKEMCMKTYFSQRLGTERLDDEDFSPVNPKASLRDSIEKTRQALDIAYAGFDNALEEDLIDSYIYQINSLQKRYKHLSDLAAEEPPFQENTPLYKHSPIRALVSHVFG